MRILMPVAFNAEHGGLHDHVAEIAEEAAEQSIEITVAARPGPFLDKLAAAGIPTLPVDLSDVEATCQTAKLNGPWDLVHTHPFEARAFAVEFTRREGLPLIATFHGWYSDEVETWHQHADALIAVTGALEQRLHSVSGIEHERIHLVENRLKVLPASLTHFHPENDRTPILSVASRLDADFASTQRTLIEFIARATEQGENAPRWRIEIAGQGTRRVDITRELLELCMADGAPEVSFLGWLDSDQLRALYARSFATIAPGRAGMDAMAAGLPTILTRQIGTYALAPAGDTHKLLHGSPGSAVSGADFFDFCMSAYWNPDTRRKFAFQAASIVRARFDPKALAGRLHSIYHSVARNRRLPSISPREHQSLPDGQLDQFTIGRFGQLIVVDYTRNPSGLEFAFYVYSQSTRTRVEWYSESSNLTIDTQDGEPATSVRAFVRDTSGTVTIHDIQIEDI